MKHFVALLAILGLFFALPLLAQIPAPTPPAQAIQLFTLTGAATGFNQGGSSSVASTAGASVQLTNSIALGYNQVTIPSRASYNLGTFNYSTPLSSLFGKTLTSKFLVDLTQVGVTFQVGAGKQNASSGIVGVAASSHVAEIAGAAIYYPLATHVDIQVFGYQYIHSNISGVIRTNGQNSVSTGFAFHF
jgi:hypothetical protein